MAVLRTPNFTLEWRFHYTSIDNCDVAMSYFWLLAKTGENYLIAPSLLAELGSHHADAPEGALACEDCDFDSLRMLRAALQYEGEHRHYDSAFETPDIFFQSHDNGKFVKITVEIGSHDFAAQVAQYNLGTFEINLNFTVWRPDLEAFLFDLLDELDAASYAMDAESRVILNTHFGDLDREARTLPYLGKSRDA